MVPDAIDLASIRRVLVIKLRHHGDVLLTSPVFQVLKNHGPHLEIDALVYHDTRDMLSLHPAVSQVHTVDRTWRTLGAVAQLRAEWGLRGTLRLRRYDLIVHLTEAPRGAWLARALGPRYAVARKHPGRGRLWAGSFTHLYPYPKATPRHTVELHLDALRRIGVYPNEQERRLVLVPGPEAEAAVGQLLAEHRLAHHGYVHIHPTSRWLFKCWPEEKVGALIARLQAQGERVVVTAAPDDREMEMVKRILAPLATRPVDLAGRLSLKQLAALTANAKLFIGVDSAPMHIAAAMQTPVVALFGPSGDIEWGPWMVRSRVITSDHPCRPCGNDGCGGGKVSECLTVLPVERVLGAISELLR
jgi:heptosyltransferase-3